MVIFIGADHRGFELKEYIEKIIRAMGYEVVDVGDGEYRADDDYPDIARAVAERVSQGYENSRGILVCGSGVGVDIVANKSRHIRSALVSNSDQAYDSRDADDANILSLAADYISKDEVKKILVTWIETPFSGKERYNRRLQKIYKIENEVFREI